MSPTCECAWSEHGQPGRECVAECDNAGSKNGWQQQCHEENGFSASGLHYPLLIWGVTHSRPEHATPSRPGSWLGESEAAALLLAPALCFFRSFLFLFLAGTKLCVGISVLHRLTWRFKLECEGVGVFSGFEGNDVVVGCALQDLCHGGHVDTEVDVLVTPE